MIRNILISTIYLFSIKHDLAISCFQLWPKIGDEGDKKLARRQPRQFFLEILSPSEPILRAKIKNMISTDYVLCNIPQTLEILGKNGIVGIYSMSNVFEVF